ncbi:MAG TPA: hypothetical protein VKP13_06940 [Nitrospira sp.]|nr:hypothetical protein [Nitrospira sp.]
MAYATNSIFNRIEWCRKQRTQARTQPELERWRAEEDGLRDALLHRDHTKLYRYSPSDVFARYAMGLHDGQAMLRVARVTLQLALRPQEVRNADPRIGDAGCTRL